MQFHLVNNILFISLFTAKLWTKLWKFFSSILKQLERLLTLRHSINNHILFNLVRFSEPMKEIEQLSKKKILICFFVLQFLFQKSASTFIESLMKWWKTNRYSLNLTWKISFNLRLKQTSLFDTMLNSTKRWSCLKLKEDIHKILKKRKHERNCLNRSWFVRCWQPSHSAEFLDQDDWNDQSLQNFTESFLTKTLTMRTTLSAILKQQKIASSSWTNSEFYLLLKVMMLNFKHKKENSETVVSSNTFPVLHNFNEMYTPPDAVDIISKYLPKDKVYWEACYGMWHFANRLKENWFDVIWERERLIVYRKIQIDEIYLLLIHHLTEIKSL